MCRTAQLHDEIVNLRLDSTYKSQVDFLLHFADLVRLHSEKVILSRDNLTDSQKKQYLIQAVSPASNLRAVQVREMERIVGEMIQPHSYFQYF